MDSFDSFEDSSSLEDTSSYLYSDEMSDEEAARQALVHPPQHLYSGAHHPVNSATPNKNQIDVDVSPHGEELLNQMIYDDDEDMLYDEDGLPMDELYGDDYGDEGYFDEDKNEYSNAEMSDESGDGDDGDQTDGSSGDDGASKGGAGGGGGGAAPADSGAVEINVKISEKKKNDIIDTADVLDGHDMRQQDVQAKADNDMESSDLNFSEENAKLDEHEY
jgi:hypothetical protein|mmetsp:Transcript_44694/g.59319  ORF Transcript_44694/g.59319 Transcript_44694/m.59319 type:complete len:219 (-) Transcript_44694:405-1061(-)